MAVVLDEDKSMAYYKKDVTPRLGVTKALLVNLSLSKIFDLAKVPVTIFESHSYLTDVAAAELQRHL